MVMSAISSSYLHRVFPEERKEKDTSNTHNSFLYEDLTGFSFCPFQRATEENHTALPMGLATRL